LGVKQKDLGNKKKIFAVVNGQKIPFNGVIEDNKSSDSDDKTQPNFWGNDVV